MPDTLYAQAETRMKKAIEAVQNEFNKVRTGRANANMLDGITVEYYGATTPLNQVATISVPEARLIVIQPWDPKVLPGIEKAIQKADLNIAPVNDGKIIRLPIPQLTEERRRELVKLVKRSLEEGKISIRNVRREINELLKKGEKSGQFSEDEQKRQEEKVQQLTDNSIGELDGLAAKKEKEIMTV
jgi:ribosome recycling factor